MGIGSLEFGVERWILVGDTLYVNLRIATIDEIYEAEWPFTYINTVILSTIFL
jgi:hypothetical protein